jgi:hypothetical protein
MRRLVTHAAVRRYVGTSTSEDPDCLAVRGQISKKKHVKTGQVGDQLKPKTGYQYISAANMLYQIEQAVNILDSAIDPIPLCTSQVSHRNQMKNMSKTLTTSANYSRVERHGAEIGVPITVLDVDNLLDSNWEAMRGQMLSPEARNAALLQQDMTYSLGTGLRSNNRCNVRVADVSFIEYTVPNGLGPATTVNGRTNYHETLYVLNTGVAETKTELSLNGMAKGMLAHQNVQDCPIVSFYIAMLVENWWGGHPLRVGEKGWMDRLVLSMDGSGVGARELREL